MYNKILVANRGEIALRIIRACRELNIRTVAVYSKVDELSLHTKFADEAICIGPPASAQSYLNIPAIIAAAELTNADAIHPGYGFLAESSKFSGICADNNIEFIGPPPETIDAMGNKAKAKESMININDKYNLFIYQSKIKGNTLKLYQEIVSYENISGFSGSHFAKELDIINKYVLGISETLS